LVGSGIGVCIVEDDEDLREELSLALSARGFFVRAFAESRDLYAALLREPSQLLLLDLGLPGEDGHSVVRRLKDAMRIGIVICSARTEVDERVRSMMAGADAYLVKPVDVRELVATLISVHRRVSGDTAAGAPAEWFLDDNGWTLRTPGSGEVALTPAERTVLQALFATPGVAVSRESIIASLGHSTDYYLDHRLDMVLSRLRRKVRDACGDALPLRAVRGVGFVFRP
jgi:DNA-binding response OmpR family regulator